MFLNPFFDVNKYKEENEDETHWYLRKAFLERWKYHYPEGRLVYLSKVFVNMECKNWRYPSQVMDLVNLLTVEIVKPYRRWKHKKLQGNFVSESPMAQDSARGVKRIGGVEVEPGPSNPTRIKFVPATSVTYGGGAPITETTKSSELAPGKADEPEEEQAETEDEDREPKPSNRRYLAEYLHDLTSMECLEMNRFKDKMFKTEFGQMVMLIRPWADKMWNIQASCEACQIPMSVTYEGNWYSVIINGELVTRVYDKIKSSAKSVAGNIAWDTLRAKMICVLIKEQWIAQGESRISVSQVNGSATRQEAFGTPVENDVAIKMMQTMGWNGGGLGADSQGISEPIRPEFQVVQQAGLGSNVKNEAHLRRTALGLMYRYIASDNLDYDLVFSCEFSKLERAVIHQCASKVGLSSRSYGHRDNDRFLVVYQKWDPFSLVKAVVEKGGDTLKYQVFIPGNLCRTAPSTKVE